MPAAHKTSFCRYPKTPKSADTTCRHKTNPVCVATFLCPTKTSTIIARAHSDNNLDKNTSQTKQHKNCRGPRNHSPKPFPVPIPETLPRHHTPDPAPYHSPSAHLKHTPEWTPQLRSSPLPHSQGLEHLPASLPVPFTRILANLPHTTHPSLAPQPRTTSRTSSTVPHHSTDPCHFP